MKETGLAELIEKEKQRLIKESEEEAQKEIIQTKEALKQSISNDMKHFVPEFLFNEEPE